MTRSCCDGFVVHGYRLDLREELVWLVNERGGVCLL